MTTEELNETFGDLVDAVRKGSVSGILRLDDKVKKCKVCGNHYARLHYNRFHFLDKKTSGRGEMWFYVDCECGHGTVTGWYRTREEAEAAWNRGRNLDEVTAFVEGR